MTTDLDSYLVEIVDPAISEFREWQWSRRRGFIACVCLFHTIDYFPKPPLKRTRRGGYRVASPDFAAVDRVAHAFKHKQSSDDGRALRSSQVSARPPAVAGLMMCGASIVGDSRGGLRIGGEKDDLFPIVRRAREFIESERALIKRRSTGAGD